MKPDNGEARDRSADLDDPAPFAARPGDKASKARFLRLVVLVLVLLVATGLYVIKNADRSNAEGNSTGGEGNSTGASGQYRSAAFALDATAGFDMDAILSHNLPVLVDFGADTCEPCKAMAPILKELNDELRGKAVIKFVDVWKNAAAGKEVPLEVIPTQFFFNADGSPYVPADPEAAAKQGFIMYELKDSGRHVYTAHQGGMNKAEMLAVLEEMGMK